MEYFPQVLASKKEPESTQVSSVMQDNTAAYSNERVLQLAQLNSVRRRIPELINRLPSINVKYQSEMMLLGEVVTVLRMLHDLMEIK